MSLVICTAPGCDTTAGCVCGQRVPAAPVNITPLMVKAAWAEARKWWPYQVVETTRCKACGQSKGFAVKQTCILVDEPQPGFREALEAALRAAT